MGPSFAPVAVVAHPERLRTPLALGEVDPKKVQKLAQWAKDGAVLSLCIALANKRQKAAATLVGMGENQLAAQIAGTERPQMERFENHKVFAGPMQVAKALQHPDVFEVTWTITAKVQP